MKHRIPLCVACALAAVTLWVGPGLANGEGVRCQVTTPVLRVRSAPAEGQIGTAYGGTWLTATERDAEATWAKVEWSGRDAWVMTQFLDCESPLAGLAEARGEAAEAAPAPQTTEEPQPAAQEETAPPQAARSRADDLAWALFEAINATRARVGLPAYEWDDRAYTAAQWQAEDMVSRRYFAHNTPDGRTPSDLMRAEGIVCGGWCGQNIIMGQTADEVGYSLNWFMNSTVHRNNLLNRQYTAIGIGVAAVRSGVRYYVLNFARR